ncbi:hypothetical protein GCM10027360_91160 [Amycolatopsis echigonensis]
MTTGPTSAGGGGAGTGIATLAGRSAGDTKALCGQAGGARVRLAAAFPDQATELGDPRGAQDQGEQGRADCGDEKGERQ